MTAPSEPPAKPSLHDIAAMPFPASEIALEKFYGVKPWRGEPLKKYTVDVVWVEISHRSDSFEVEAYSQEEAEDITHQNAGDGTDADDIDFLTTTVREVQA